MTTEFNAKIRYMPHLLTWIVYWFLLAGFILAIYHLTVTGRLYCTAVYIGHAWAVLKEEVMRPVRVIKKALSRKDMELDEHEESISG